MNPFPTLDSASFAPENGGFIVPPLQSSSMAKQQKSLFETAPEAWEVDDEDFRLVATVIFSEGPETPFDYIVPPRLMGEVEPGRRVRVPLGYGNRRVEGYCVAADHQNIALRSHKLKEVQEVLDSTSLLSPAMLRLTRWMSDYYLCPWGQTIEAVLPGGVRDRAGTRETTLLSVPESTKQKLAELKLPPKQKAALELLAASGTPLTPPQLAQAAGCTMVPITGLRKKKLLHVEVRRVHHQAHLEPPAARTQPLALNDPQAKALAAITGGLHSGRHGTFVLHGVTGSGKTEVYIQAIEEVVRFGRQAIVLVPEISLTPQTRHRFRQRFDHVAVLHSNMSGSERHWHWRQIEKGRVQVIIGPRSAIFAPAPHLGLIVIDEEHDASFKQDSSPRYHAREVALQRAQAEKIPLVLGSATPSLETLHQGRTGKYQILELPHRVMNRPLPEVATLDLRAEWANSRDRGAISRPLAHSMRQSLNEGGQVILLLNRRGFSTHIQCPGCGHVVKCVDCDIALTHHRQGEIAICHCCDHRVPAPNTCPECGQADIRYSGLGTQRLEAEVKSQFGDVECLRMDSDTMQKPGSHEQALSRFRRGEVRILLGTQMISKGLDFPNVTLVGVVNADTALHLPDFRAAERTFQLVTQVAGRTGRGEKPGRVLVQTFSPEHPAIVAALRHDYLGFADYELPVRQEYSYPPFSSMIRIEVRSPVESQAEQFLEEVAGRIEKVIDERELEIRVLGPAPAPVTRRFGKYRFHLLLQSEEGDSLRAAVSAATEKLKTPEEIVCVIDVDPLDFQ